MDNKRMPDNPSLGSSAAASADTRIYYGWVIVALAMLMQAVTSGGVNSLYGVYAVPFSETFGLTRAQVMLGTASICILCSGLFSPLGGIALQRYSNRGLILGAGALLTFAYLLLSQASAFWQVAVIYGLLMSVANTLYGALAATTSVSNWFVKGRGRALGFAAIGISIGSFVFPPVVSWIIVEYSWRHATAAMSGVVFVSLLVVARFYLSHPGRPAGKSDAVPAKPPASIASVLRNANFWLIGLSISICFASFNGLTTNLVPMAVDQGVTQKKASLLLSLSATFGVIGKLSIGFSADRLGARTALTLPLLSVCVGSLILLGKPAFSTMLVAAMFIGLAAGGAIPVWGALIGSYFGQRDFSLVMGLMNPLLVPLIVLSAPFISYINERFGTYNPALFTLVGFAVTAIALASLLKEPAERR